jgi:hypothetical protein
MVGGVSRSSEAVAGIVGHLRTKVANLTARARKLGNRGGHSGAVVSPYIHRYPDRIECPLTGTVMSTSDPLWLRIAGIPPGGAIGHGTPLGEAEFCRLLDDGYLLLDVEAAAHQSRLTYASIETCSTCNHRCAFCPVSVAPRPREVMPQDLFQRIVDEVVEEGVPEITVFLSNYNEPTVDPLFLDRLRYLLSKGVPTAILTNASELGPEKVDAIRSMGRLRYLGVNLPTLDPDRYRKLHGTSDLTRIVGHVDYLLEHGIAEQSAVVVLGYGDEQHDRDLAEIEQRFGGHGWEARKSVVQSRAGLIEISQPMSCKTARLSGCEQTGSRPLQHLHVVASGKAILCCQDYYERYPVGDLQRQTVRDVLGSDAFAQLRRWVYGVEDSPQDFMCRECEFALTREDWSKPRVGGSVDNGAMAR